MDDRAEQTTATVSASPVAYDPPRLTPIGTLQDLLAGLGTAACDGPIAQQGPDPISPACAE
jgi:hypothetical protein